MVQAGSAGVFGVAGSGKFVRHFIRAKVFSATELYSTSIDGIGLTNKARNKNISSKFKKEKT